MKHREKDIKKGSLTLLKVLENQGTIAWFDRLNSGRYFIPSMNGYKGRLIQGCRPGTADAYVILKNGRLVWLEFKNEKGKTTPEQDNFKAVVESVNHTYSIVRSVDDLISLMDTLQRSG